MTSSRVPVGRMAVELIDPLGREERKTENPVLSYVILALRWISGWKRVERRLAVRLDERLGRRLLGSSKNKNVHTQIDTPSKRMN